MNLLSIPQLEKDGYTIDYNTKRNWVVMTSSGKCLLFKSHTGLCVGMPYLDICENHEALVLIQTVPENFGKFTERQVNRAFAARDMQARMSHPTDESFKQMVSGKKHLTIALLLPVTLLMVEPFLVLTAQV